MRYLVALLIFFAAGTAGATTVGTVNLAKVPAWQQATQAINARTAEFQADVSARDAEVKRLEEAKDATAPEKREDLGKRVSGYQQRLDGMTKDRDDKLAAAAKLVADARGLDVIGSAVWARDGLDVTEDVAKAYGGAVAPPARPWWVLLDVPLMAIVGIACYLLGRRPRRRTETAQVLPTRLGSVGG